ncbi:MAG TPA: hypothetical protein VLW84_06545 [Terriglobales bacterium]|nr:hypothetical protein [Terriglobales bacterium]
MNKRNRLPRPSGIFVFAGLLILTGTVNAQIQPAATAGPPPQESMASAVQQLQEEVRELHAAVQELRSEAVQYRAEATELRHELETERGSTAASATPAQNPPQVAPAPAESGAANSAATQTLEQRVASLEEGAQLLNSKVDDQYQTKVESASKYRVRLSGILLFNLFSNRGYVDNQDVPTWVLPEDVGSGHTAGGSVRQSEFGLEVFGPHLAGARASGNVQVDFSGGFPDTLNGLSYGLVRLRTADVRLDWDRTSLIVGQDNLFLSPSTPTSFASLSVPALAYAGNLWGWIPQARVEHRFSLSERQTLTWQAGVLDNFTGEPPQASYVRFPTAGENSGQPAYATRVAWSRDVLGRPLIFGASGYYSRQDWGLPSKVDGWAGITDWQIPLLSRLSLSGEFYRGRGIGGLGGAFGRSVIFSGPESTPGTELRAVNSAGGWSQLKFTLSPKVEFNGAFGLDNPYAQDLRAFPQPTSYFPASIGQNRGAFLNIIYRPRSALLLAGEYRRLRTFEIPGGSPTAEQVNLSMGILF